MNSTFTYSEHHYSDDELPYDCDLLFDCSQRDLDSRFTVIELPYEYIEICYSFAEYSLKYDSTDVFTLGKKVRFEYLQSLESLEYLENDLLGNELKEIEFDSDTW